LSGNLIPLNPLTLKDSKGCPAKGKKMYKKKKTPVRDNKPKGKLAQPFDGLDPLEGEVSRNNSRYYLRREGKSIYRHSK
jgi:hypothetical protein